MQDNSGEGENTRDRLLRAAAELLDAAPGEPVSTRAICARAGVGAPTLYHHFGSKQGLLDAVVEYGLGQYSTGGTDGDVIADLREGWDNHVRYGLDHPAFYVLLYGRIAPGRPCKVTAVAEARLRVLVDRLDRDGLLSVPVDEAVQQIVAANVGITLQLIAQPAGAADLTLSTALRENVLGGVIATAALGRTAGTGGEVGDVAAWLAELLGAGGAGASELSAGERTLLGEWLARMADTCT
ncbi:TetR/AcrR family transcriptional regulator [Mycobacterium sp. CVI_P3]|uniref:TetR/AcrR family transcriptional regulator n=1 Tax=Mycobacterium pinniadriaticum TaxID=2994102 RepID=A0ABT3SPE8_9MYCO|nr:TetR/AcrR family transcriptional regulator [Mycobacterium pinniadriaticum]MCX2934980.1 TetR/AcrR family transcriptional regulator [Mycobacterium pinniadriaticum]MCX2941402.1 TetR/AcrR family transcriptional regulator [Mycobacterium pinniadriaticum]